MAEAALVGPQDAAWSDALTRIAHDVYHTPEYVELDAQLSAGTAAAFVYSDGGNVLLLPLVLRPIPGSELRDAASPYGYSGPVSNADAGDTGFWKQACQAMVELLCTKGVVTAFVRLHPFLPAPLETLGCIGTVVQHGQTVSMDLSLNAEEMWQQTHRTHRNQINKSRRAGVTVEMDHWDRLDEWVETYHANMLRVGASDYYFFTTDHFHRLRAALGDHAHLAIAYADGEVLGGNLFFEYDGIMHTYLQSTRGTGVNHADKLLYDEIRRWGRERANIVYHIGGGLGGESDSLFRYKAAFAAGRHDFHTWRVVTDPNAYAALIGAGAGEPALATMSGRFPPYR
jgi:GNAT acetyltransferase-like protein